MENKLLGIYGYSVSPGGEAMIDITGITETAPWPDDSEMVKFLSKLRALSDVRYCAPDPFRREH